MTSARSREYANQEALGRTEARLRAARDAPRWVPMDADAVRELMARVESDDADIAHRRETENTLGRYIGDRFSGQPEEFADLLDLKARMETCHTSGAWGVHVTDGRTQHVVCWNEKCRDLHLCPHEAKANQARLVKAYVPAVQQWLAASPIHSAHYAVFTVPNVPVGQLREGRAAALKRWGEWFNTKREPTDRERMRHGLSQRVRSVPAWRPIGGTGHGIAGALVHVEDPLSDRGDWNVHLNVILLVRGALDYGALRRTWGFDVELRLLRDTSAEGLTLQLCEVVKYSAKRPESMASWPPLKFAEWWRSQKGARRTRSYGCLHGLKTRAEGVDPAYVQWMGSVRWAGNRYALTLERGLGRSAGVGLVTADNFPSWADEFEPNLATAPPDWAGHHP